MKLVSIEKKFLGLVGFAKSAQINGQNIENHQKGIFKDMGIFIS